MLWVSKMDMITFLYYISIWFSLSENNFYIWDCYLFNTLTALNGDETFAISFSFILHKLELRM